MTGRGEAQRIALGERAAALSRIAQDMKVMPGTISEINLARARSDLETIELAIAGLQGSDDRDSGALDWVEDRLRGIGILLETALFMGGMATNGAVSMFDLQQQLCAILQRDA